MPHQFPDSSVADVERRLSRKQDHAGAIPAGGSTFFNQVSHRISDLLHGVIAALLVVDETVPGQNRLREPFQRDSNVRKAKSSSRWFASPPYPVRVWGARPSWSGILPGSALLSAGRMRVQIPLRTTYFISSDTREPENSLGLGPSRARGSTGVSDHFLHWSVA